MGSEESLTQLMRRMMEDRRLEREEQEKKERLDKAERDAKDKREKEFMKMIVDNQQEQRNDMIKTSREDRKIEKALVRLPRMIEGDYQERFVVSMEKLLT